MNGYTVAGPRSGGTAQAAAPWRRATRGESRWPAVIAAVAASALQMALPGWLSLGPQMQQPELAPPGWKPSFTDYLYLSFTSAISFAASDVTPLTPLGEDHDDAAIGRLGRGHRARGRQGGEHPPLTS